MMSRTQRISRFNKDLNIDFQIKFQPPVHNNNVLSVKKSDKKSNRTSFCFQLQPNSKISIQQKQISNYSSINNFSNMNNSYKQSKTHFQSQQYHYQQNKFQSDIIKKKTNEQQIHKNRQILLNLHNLNEKPKKQKLKHINIEFIKFIFQIFQKKQFFSRILETYIPHQVILTQFVQIAHNFQIKKINLGQIIFINAQRTQYFILLNGAMQKKSLKEICKLSRLSRRSNKSNTHIILSQQDQQIRRSNLKSKTTKQKQKIHCFQNDIPRLVNEHNHSQYTLKTLMNCEFIIIDKTYWNKFIYNLEKLEDKFMINFIKLCTTINLKICSNIVEENIKIEEQEEQEEQEKEKQKQKNQFVRKQLLEKIRGKNFYENIQYDRINNNQLQKKQFSQQYELISMYKCQKKNLDNSNIYILSKGKLFVQNQSYDIFLMEGSLINSSIILEKQRKQIKIQAQQQCILIKITLNSVLFTQQQENQFINKVQQIQNLRKEICRKKHYDLRDIVGEKKFKKNNQKKAMENPYQQHQVQVQKQNQIYLTQQQKKNLKKFTPDRIQMKYLSSRTQKNNRSNAKLKQRITKYRKTQQQKQSQPKQSYQNYLARKVAIKYANNYCIFQKLIESQKKVLQTIKNNQNKRIFFKTEFDLNKQNMIICSTRKIKRNIFAKSNKRLRTQKIENYNKQNNINSINNKFITQINNNYQKSIQQELPTNNLQKQSRRKTINLQESRVQQQKSRIQKRKKQKNKAIQNLFQIEQFDSKSILFNNQLAQQQQQKNKNKSNDYMKQKIKNIINHNSIIKLSQYINDKEYVQLDGQGMIKSSRDFEEMLEKQYFIPSITKESKNYTNKSKYKQKLMLTQPDNFKQTFIYGQNFMKNKFNFNINDRTHDMTKLKPILTDISKQLTKNQSKKIKAQMLTGRLRQFKKKY